jgi:hypothetical protein
VGDDFAWPGLTSTFLWISAFRDASGISRTEDDESQPAKSTRLAMRATPAVETNLRRAGGNVLPQAAGTRGVPWRTAHGVCLLLFCVETNRRRAAGNVLTQVAGALGVARRTAHGVCLLLFCAARLAFLDLGSLMVGFPQKIRARSESSSRAAKFSLGALRFAAAALRRPVQGVETGVFRVDFRMERTHGTAGDRPSA